MSAQPPGRRPLPDNGAMDCVLTADPTEFHDRTWSFLEQRIECNVLATVLLAVLRGRFEQSLFAYCTDRDGTVTAAALRTPPFALVASEIERAAAEQLIDRWLAVDPELSGVNATPASARALVTAWRKRTGGESECVRKMAAHTLQRVIDPARPAAGRLRPAGRWERDLLVRWWREFAAEAASERGARSAAHVDARLDDGNLFVWDDGEPVSFVALSPAVAGVVRIGPVYTPPEHRRRGYASSAVAAASGHALAGDATTCMLYTDLDNPTSNKIYAEVGYRRIGEWEEHVLRRRPGPDR